MCGIAGFAGAGDVSVLRRMLSIIRHRGPDDQGMWCDSSETVWFGHNRLSIVDIQGGAQPMLTRDEKLCITFNGEIYNHYILRERLEKLGHRFISQHSDTEVLLHGYREWGTNVVDYLNGMWAFAIYDKENQIVFLSRDRFGKKPIYYSEQCDCFVFASELSAMLEHPAVDRTADRNAVKKYFANGYVPSPDSLIKSVHKLDAGTSLVYSLESRKGKTIRYWRFEFESDKSYTEAQWEEALRENLFLATKSRMRADVPVGVLLSGGIDSSSIVSMAVSSARFSSVKSYSIGFNDSSFDESGYAQEISNILGTQHITSVLDESNVLSVAKDVISRLDEPMADSSLLPSFLVSQLAAQDVKVVLGGDGADELFAGYDPFRVLTAAEIYSLIIPKFVHKFFQFAVNILPISHENMSLDFVLKRIMAGLSYSRELWNPVWLGTTEPSDLSSFLGEKVEFEEVYGGALDSWAQCKSRNIYDRTIQFYIEQYLKNGILTKIDRAGMMNGLEVRSPYLDIDLVNIARRIPPSMKFNNGETKYILKKALNPVLPLDILYRKKKGFGVPIGKWFKEGSVGVDIKIEGEYYDKYFLKRKYDDHRAGRANNRTFLWAFWVFENWRKRWRISIT